MKAVEFCYWLQGYFEINDKKRGLSAKQVESIQKHLAMVFKHEIDPSYKDSDKLNQIHSGGNNPAGGDFMIRC